MLALKEYSLLTFENVMQERVRAHLFQQITTPFGFFKAFPYSDKEIKSSAKARTDFFLEQLAAPIVVEEEQLINQDPIKTLGKTQNKQYDLANNFKDAKIFDIDGSGVKLKDFEGYFIVRLENPAKQEQIVVGQEIVENFDSGDVDKFDITENVNYKINEYFLIEKSNSFVKGFNNLGKVGDTLVILGNASADAAQQLANQNNTSVNFSKKFELNDTSAALSQYDFNYSPQGEVLTLVSSVQTNENNISALYKSFITSIQENKKYYQFAAYYIRRNGTIEGITPIKSKPTSKSLYVKEANQGILELFAKEFGDVALIISQLVSTSEANSIKNITFEKTVGYPLSKNNAYGGSENITSKKNSELQKTINNIDRNLITLINSIEVV